MEELIKLQKQIQDLNYDLYDKEAELCHLQSEIDKIRSEINQNKIRAKEIFNENFRTYDDIMMP